MAFRHALREAVMIGQIVAFAGWRQGGALLERAGWALIHFLWQGAAVAASLALVLMLMRCASAAARYRVACGAMIAMAVIPAVTFWALKVDVNPRRAVVPAIIAGPATPIARTEQLPEPAATHSTGLQS